MYNSEYFELSRYMKSIIEHFWTIYPKCILLIAPGVLYIIIVQIFLG